MTDTKSTQPEQALGMGRTVDVDVIAELDPETKEVSFRLDSDLKDDDDELVFDQNRDEMRKPDYYLVEFNLVDRTGLGLRFTPSTKDAFWVNMGPDDRDSPPCPTTPSYSEEIRAVDVSKKKLTVRNENNTVAKFTYSLGFLTSDGNDLRFDPGGTNKDGGI